MRFITAPIIRQLGSPPYRLDCTCRKPKAGLIERAATDFEIDLQSSWMIDDRYSDIELARNAGLNSAFVLSGYGRGEWEYQRNWLETSCQIFPYRKIFSLHKIDSVAVEGKALSNERTILQERLLSIVR